MDSRRKNMLKRARIVQEIVRDNYEPGNQSKCKSQVYRKYICNKVPMCERTFWEMLSMDVEALEKERGKDEDPRQLRLFE
jgi:hypothetical protein